MPSFGKTSTSRLNTCDHDIQRVMYRAIQIVDFSVVFGHRGKADQNKAEADGYSTKRWPDSEHNSVPSNAIDVLPYPSGWPQKDDPLDIKIAKWGQFYYMAGIIMQCAHDEGVELIWGNDWDGDGDFLETNFRDAAHFQRKK